MNFAVTESMDSICCCFTASIICVTAKRVAFRSSINIRLFMDNYLLWKKGSKSCGWVDLDTWKEPELD